MAECKWTHDENGWDGSTDVWSTDCGEEFVFTDEGPVANGCKFCCYCAGQLVEVRIPFVEDTDGQG